MKKLKFIIPALCLVISTQLWVTSPSFAQNDSPAVHQVITQNPDSVLQSKDSVVLKTSDSTIVTVPTSTITAPDNYTIFGVKLPTWANWIITIGLSLIVVLPGIQLVLKRIPGGEPISGFLGKILNVLTWFQKNIVTQDKRD